MNWNRTTIGFVLLTLGVALRTSEIGKTANTELNLSMLIGLVLLLPAIKEVKKNLLKTENKEVDEKKMLTAKLFYAGAIVVGLMALSYQGELKSQGYIYAGRGQSYAISGSDAEQQVTACWIGAATSLAIAMFFHLRSRKHSN